MNSRTLTVLVTLAAATAALGGSAATAAGPRPKEAAVTGSAQVLYVPSPEDDVRLTFDAHATYGEGPVPTGTRGTVRVFHHFVAPGMKVWAEADVDCVMATGRIATVTAVVGKTSPELAEVWMGRRIGFTVLDTGRRGDQVGMAGPLENVPRCLGAKPYLGPTPFSLLRQGDLKLRHNLPPVP
ncbi:hypothetical protein GCM10023085_69870 [Actinomadura viridis]|uniref:Uncharacterized protein n=1 Tax=Actinomadura viridis TaxID=58110 RepID=A0A931GP28_9ACTN|nr:hypothetical protein [Actinomadura viridis]MBG6090156.1 hypothetical protein [Actinomadura viridis]